MANRNFPQSRVFGMHMMPVSLDLSISIGASGAPTIESGSGLGIKAITRLSAGRYRLQLEDNYSKLLSFQAMFRSPVTGSALGVTAAGAALTVGTVYSIVSLGTTTTANWNTLGVPSGITPAVGVIFKAAATGAGTGNGTVKAIGSSGIVSCELMGDENQMLNNQPFTARNGGYVDFQCLGMAAHAHDILLKDAAVVDGATTRVNAGDNLLGANTGSDITVAGAGANGGVQNSTQTLTPSDPADGSIMYVKILLSNSSVQ